MRSAATEKPSEVSEIQPTPKGKQNQKVPPAGAHNWEKAPQGEGGKAEPKDDPVEGKEAEKAQGSGGQEAADFCGVDRVEIEIFDLGADQSASAERLI